jgi:glyoxylase I family protein
MALDIQGICPLIQVFDMRTSVAFYCDKLGFEVYAHAPFYAGDEFHWARLKRGDGTELMLNTAYDEGERPAEPDLARVTAHGDTCLYFHCPDPEAAYQELLAKGVSVKPPKVAPYGMKQLYFRDPDGYGLCFQCLV